MAEHDWEALYGALETATEQHSRAELVALLRDLIRTYVIERGLPTGAPSAATPDLTTLDFPRLVGWLKRNLSLPELARFEVDGDRVIVDADGPRVISGGPTARPTAGWPASGGAPGPRVEERSTDAWPMSAAGAAARPGAPRPAAPRPAASPAQPAPAPSAAPADDGGNEGPARTLSPGFRGLEFD